MRWIYSICLLVLLFGTGAPREAQAEPFLQVQPAHFEFFIPPSPETSVVRIDSAAVISQARAMLSGQASMQHIMGKIVKTPAA